jgi:hypothetical protein
MSRPRPDLDEDYASLRARLHHAPRTWYPGLLAALIELSYAAGCWKPGGASTFVQEVERKIRVAAALGKSDKKP